ncbi:hypothetical protein M4914_20925 [Streptomyces somaliensis DSM 40738]|uniref:Cyclic nucleotide-binding domain-containing protein n=1 Tax=Streptomyces somaliensis (strain ATCC 33201 / DSM 40738 / JCM 12659 / KCTC 9044 / NCTC 11332 / NRRL B-12077 / IP 733) TaxID=1134445 RepID=A0AA44DBV2_STRE0|nr:hypothetical protein [Streptomyces somaliensis]MCQ0025159.1 hypothetical protein [Streptomyces somaliensis DSM 40738]NKY13407.1 hypothetical protein [Streptomyces somaliensis DSM 40738]
MKAGSARRAIAVDGKVVRSSRTKTATAIHLLAVMDHHGVTPTQRRVASESDEVFSFAPLLDGLDPKNSVVTADALRTQHDHGACPTGRGAHRRAGSDVVSQARLGDGHLTILEGRAR